MHDAIKIAIGAGAAAALALIAHGPLGKGRAFIEALQHRAGDALVARGISAQGLSFQSAPLARVAILNGALPEASRADAAAIVNAVPGVAFTRADKGARPMAGATIADTAEPEPRFSAPVAPDADIPTTQPTPSAGAAGDAARCQDGVDKAVAGRMLVFRSGSAWLNPQSRRIVADVAAALKGCPGMTVAVGGHSDGHGSETVNKAMSQERARRVRDALIEQGVPAGAVTARGYGSSVPLRPDNPLDPANRRIAFTVTKGSD